MKKFFGFLIFSQDNGLLNKVNYSYKSSFIQYAKHLLDIKNYEKYINIIFFRNFLIKILSIFYIPIGLVLYLLNYRIIGSNSFSIGTYVEEIEKIIIENETDRKKLVLLSAKNFCANNFLDDLIFSKKITIIKNNFFCFLLTPLSFLNFLRISPYDLGPNEKLYYEKQFYEFKKNKKIGVFDHDIFNNGIEKRLKNKDFLKFIEKEHFKKVLRSKININSKKICIFHVRNANDSKLRNFDYKNYIKTIKYLIENNFVVLNFTDKATDLKISGYLEFDINLNENKETQIISMICADLFLGSQSGPGMLAKFLELPSVLTNAINFNNLYQHDNYRVIFKKYYYNNEILNLKKIFSMNLDCIWDENILKNLNINYEDNSEDEIFNATIELLHNTGLKDNLIEIIKNNKITFNNMHHAILRNTSDYYLKKNNLIN